MRIWDLPAGYLNRQSLLGEHRELHGIHSILTNGKTGYARHPETLRWARALSGLALRHRQLVEEMRLRGYVDRTPLRCMPTKTTWPGSFVDEPAEQVALLRQKYIRREKGRIPLPAHVKELWAQHKYSVMARSPESCRAIGRVVGRMHRGAPIAELARDLIRILRDPPSQDRLLNAIEHMWGHVRKQAGANDVADAKTSPGALLACTQRLALRHREPFLLYSVALSELAVFVDVEK